MEDRGNFSGTSIMAIISNSSAEASGNKKAFMEEASSYMTFKVGEAIHTFYFPFIVIVGIVGNILSFLVMIKPQNRKISTCVYMACLSVSDTVLLIYQGYSIWILPRFKLHPFVSSHCKWNMFTSFCFSMIGSLIITAMTFDKCFAIKFPHKSASFNTSGRAKIVVLVILIFSTFFNLPQFYVTLLIDGTCMPYAKKDIWNQMFMFISFFLNAVVIFSAIIIMNIFIIDVVRRRKKILRTEVTGRNRKSSVSDMKQRSTERQITIMLLLVSFLYIILIGPGFVHFIYWLIIYPRRDPRTYANFVLSYNVCQKLFFTNNAINFFLYCISGRKFRKDLKSLFCGEPDKLRSEDWEKIESWNTSSGYQPDRGTVQSYRLNEVLRL